MSSATEPYLNDLPDVQRAVLQHLRKTILAQVPDATEIISTNVPAFRYKGKYLVGISAAKNHLALLVMQGNATRSLRQDLEPYDTGSKIIRFTADNPLPADLVEKIVCFRQSEVDDRH
jgi:uncharacterized protein YdhG (YjbR/CyaY superfamily)